MRLMDSDDSGLWEPNKAGGISLVATHQHQIKQGDPTQAIYVNNLVKYRTPMDSDDFQTLPLSSAVKIFSETQSLRDDPGFSDSPTKFKASVDVPPLSAKLF